MVTSHTCILGILWQSMLFYRFDCVRNTEGITLGFETLSRGSGPEISRWGERHNTSTNWLWQNLHCYKTDTASHPGKSQRLVTIIVYRF